MKPTDPSPSRRDFLGKASAAAGSILLPVAASAQVEGNSTLKVALVGCGGRGSGAAGQALSVPGCKLVAAADVDEARMRGSLDNLKQKHGEKVEVKDDHKFLGFDAYLKAIDLADVVILATPPGFRPMMFEAAVKAGKHVFMEKPVATDAVGVRRVLEAAKIADQKKLKVVVGLQRRYQKSYLETLAQLKAGAIGEIISAQAYWNQGVLWVKERLPEDTEMQYQVRNWYYFAWLGGDNIVEQHIHNLDVINWFLDGHPVKARGMGGCEVRRGKAYGQIFDHHYVEYEYANGVICNSQSRHINGCWNQVSELFLGSKGRLSAGRITDNAGNTVWRYRGQDDADPYQVEHDEHQRHIREDKPLNNAVYGAHSTMTAILGRMATYSGKEITWDQALACNDSDFPDRLAWDAPTKVNPNPDMTYKIPVPGQHVFDFQRQG